MSVKFIVSAIGLILAGSSANAAELIVNGGFETGDFTGWTRSGTLGNTSVNAAAADTGSFGASFSPNQVGSILQNLATVVGRTYTLRFDLAHDIGPAAAINSFSVDFGGVPLQSFGNFGALPYTPLTFTVIATTAVTQLKFNFRDARITSFSLDNVSLTDNVPEPATWALLVGGFGLVGATMRRRRAVLAA